MSDRIDRYEQFAAAVSGIHRYIQQLERYEMEQYGYKGVFAQYLTVISRCEHGITLSGLCDKCDKDKAAVSRAVSEMERAGLVERGGDRSPYRAYIRLTETGKKAASFVKQRAEAAVGAVGHSLPKEDLEIFYTMLFAIADNLLRLTKEGIPEA